MRKRPSWAKPTPTPSLAMKALVQTLVVVVVVVVVVVFVLHFLVSFLGPFLEVRCRPSLSLLRLGFLLGVALVAAVVAGGMKAKRVDSRVGWSALSFSI